LLASSEGSGTNVILEEINKYLDDNNYDDLKIVYMKKELIKFMKHRNYMIDVL